jgi:hypothetical protein
MLMLWQRGSASHAAAPFAAQSLAETEHAARGEGLSIVPQLGVPVDRAAPLHVS